MKLDILVFAAHPDDAELGCAGTILKHLDAGHKVGIVDLTRGELGTRGNAEIRASEAKAASEIMGIDARENLGLEDGFFMNIPEQQVPLIRMIRKYQPAIVLANASSDRHPDHGKAGKLISDACFYAGLVKIETELDGATQAPWRPQAVYHYIQDRYIEPDIVIDITPYMDKKIEVIKAFSSQFFDPESKEPETPISSAQFMEFIKARAIDMGRIISADYGEGFVAERAIAIDDLMSLA